MSRAALLALALLAGCGIKGDPVPPREAAADAPAPSTTPATGPTPENPTP